jgi:hypothetical protein
MRRRLLAGLIASVVGGHLLLSGLLPASAATSVTNEVQFRKITFPVQGPVSYSNDWGAARTGHQHEGNDLIGKKLQVEVAAHDGTVRWVHDDGSNMLSIRDAEGWEYWYIHINNDTPGTDDGANPAEFRFFPGIGVGSKVVAGQPVAFMGDSGDAETTVPHLHFEIHKPDGTPVNPQWSLLLSQGRKALDRCAFDSNPGATPAAGAGSYWSATADGGVFSFGAAKYYGSTGGVKLASPIASLVPTSTGKGYWQLGGDGGIFTFGDARFFGSTGGVRLNKPVVGMAPTPTGNGYWLVASDGGIFTFGDAAFQGSTGGVRLQQPVIGMAPTSTGKGYWLIAADGGVFTFGDAAFLGSTGGQPVGTITDLQPMSAGNGYWLLTAGGAVLPFGDATPGLGGVDKVGFCTPPKAVAMAPTTTGKGYWVQTVDGNVFAFGDARDLGSPLRAGSVTSPAVAVATAP